MSKKGISWIVFFLCSALLIFLDQWTKALAVEYLKSGKEIQLIPNILSLLYVENAGAAFGILHGQQIIFLLITIIVLAAVLIIFYKPPIRKDICLFFFPFSWFFPELSEIVLIDKDKPM